MIDMIRFDNTVGVIFVKINNLDLAAIANIHPEKEGSDQIEIKKLVTGPEYMVLKQIIIGDGLNLVQVKNPFVSETDIQQELMKRKEYELEKIMKTQLDKLFNGGNIYE